MWGPWQVGQMTKEAYAEKAYQWAKALKLLDPSIKLILCGKEGPTSWDSYVIKECVRFDLHGLGGSKTASLIDMHSIHIYTASSDHLQNVTGKSLPFPPVPWWERLLKLEAKPPAPPSAPSRSQPPSSTSPA